MTFQPKPQRALTVALIDQLIEDAKHEARVEVAIDLCPQFKQAKKLRSAQVQTRRTKKALMAALKNSSAPAA